MRTIASCFDLSVRKNDEELHRFRRMYSIERMPAVPINMSESGWADALQAMRAPREVVEYQELIVIKDLFLGHEAIFNPLRSKRITYPTGPEPAILIDQERMSNGCKWCDKDRWHVEHEGMCSDEFGEIRSLDGRVCARANWARQAPISGLVYGDNGMHNFLMLDESEFIALFDAAESYIVLAHQYNPKAVFFMIFMNGGPKSGGSVEHAHLQVVGREDCHFSYPETIIRNTPEDYWSRVRDVHNDLGLAISSDCIDLGTSISSNCIAFANIAPKKDKDVTVFSENIQKGARFFYRVVLQPLIKHGTNNFSLAVILSPTCITGNSSVATDRFRNWPPIIWRFIDRGDMRVRRSDIGCMELFASSVVATDPFLVAQWMEDNNVSC